MNPTAMLGYMSGVPDQDPGTVPWGGRGVSMLVRAGIAVDVGFLHAVLAPNVSWHANRPFFLIPSSDTARSAFASPWYAAEVSADLPSRFGADAWALIEPGESALWAERWGMAVGGATSTQSWGPGMRGGLLLSASAPGIPRLFARTRDFVPSRLGSWAGSAFTGVVSESRYFDRDASNDQRHLQGATMAWRPRENGRVMLGAGVAVMTLRIADSAPATGTRRERETMLSGYVHGRDADGQLRIWAELARRGDHLALHDFLRVPHEGIVYLIGLERTFQYDHHAVLLSAEAANLEQPIEVREHAPRDFYTSVIIPQGWTQRGRPMGLAIGPGGQSQWVALTRVGERWSSGIFAERVRRNEDAFLRQYLPYPARHDLTMRGGVSVARLIGNREISIEASWGRRINYLFQNSKHIQNYRTMDVSVPRILLTVMPARGQRTVSPPKSTGPS